MIHNNKEVLEYWNKNEVESMYDKHLLNSEIQLIKEKISKKSKILDAGCGEAEGTLAYSSVPGVTIHAADFSVTRLRKAARRLKNRKNVVLKRVDFLGKHDLDKDYDIIISQRFLINLMEWRLQKKVLTALMKMLKKGGRLLMLEGSVKGVNELNSFRSLFGLKPIEIKWHNLFFKDDKLIKFMTSSGYKLIEVNGLGGYFMLTRGVRPIFDKELNWDSKFNKVSARREIQILLNLNERLSRLKLWVFEK